MKNQAIRIASVQHDPALEGMIKKEDARLKELARKNARHYALRNLPAPAGDTLENYTGEFRTGYERLAADLAQRTQPGAHFPEAKMHHDFFKDKDGGLVTETKKLDDQNHNDRYDLDGFNPGQIAGRIWLAIISSLVIFLGEVIFNTKAFQVTGENLLFSLILSISVSFAVLVFSHASPFLYKEAKNRIQRIKVVIGSLFLVTIVFIVLAIFRSTYLASHDVSINPLYFVVINLFFFIVSALLSFFVLPSWQEIKLNAHHLKLYYAIRKREKKIVKLNVERAGLKLDFVQKNMLRARLVHHANYSADAIRKMYWESVEIFKSTNLICRTDGRVPDCFSQGSTPPDIDGFTISIPNTHRMTP